MRPTPPRSVALTAATAAGCLAILLVSGTADAGAQSSPIPRPSPSPTATTNGGVQGCC